MRLFEEDWTTRCRGSNDHQTAIRFAVGNAQTPALLLVQVQVRGHVKLRNNGNKFLVNHAEVSLDRTIDAEAIFDVLADAVGWEGRRAFHVGRDNAKLELMQFFVGEVASIKQLAIMSHREEGIEIGAQEFEGVVLFDVGLGDALVVAYCEVKVSREKCRTEICQRFCIDR